jgi:Concanavalin A-like lectin/glucanases superfamily
MNEEDVNDTESQSKAENGWAVFSIFKKADSQNRSATPNPTKKLSSLTKLLYFLVPMLLIATFYQYSVVKGSTFFGITLRHNVDLDSGLVGHWTFDGADMSSTTATDVSGNGNDGDLSNSPIPVAGKVGQALEFGDHNNDNAIGVGGTDFDDLPAMTLSSWVKPISYGSGRGFVFNKSDGYCEVGWCLYTYVTNSEMTFAVEYTGTDLYVGVPLTADDFNNWVHWTVTWDGGTNASGVRFYRNGIEVSKGSQTSATGSRAGDSSWDLALGGNYTNRGLDGTLDDARIYNRVLSAKEIEALYKQGEGSKISVTLPTISALENGLVGHWTFDGADITDKVYDMSGQGNHGGFSGGATSSAKVAGKVGQAMQFDGVNDYISVGNQSFTNPFSLSVWLNPSSFSGSNKTFASISGCAFYIENTNGLVGYWNAGGSGSGTFSTISLNAWQHLLFTYNGVTLTAYVNGSNSGSFASTINCGPESLLISSDVEPYTGKIDDARIYNRALSAKEVEALYNLGEGTKYNVTQTNYPPLKNGLVGHWTFDGPDMTTATATDIGSQGNDGEINGARAIAGKIGQGLSFDGNDSVILAVDPMASGDRTTCSWSKLAAPMSDGSYQTILSSAYYDLKYYFGAGEYYIYQSSNASLYNYAGFGENVVGKWYHICIVRPGGSGLDSQIYINGVDSATGNDGNPNTFYDLFIGSNPYYTMYFNGSIDDVRIYNRLLTSSEVQQIYNIGR